MDRISHYYWDDSIINGCIMMKYKKAQSPYIAIGIIVLIIIFAYVFIQSQQRVFFSIQLQDAKIVEGSSTVLFYSVKNNLKEGIGNVHVEYWLNDSRYKIKEIGFMERVDLNNGAFNVFSANLKPGTYVIKTILTYYSPSKQKEIPLELTLNLEVIEEID